MPSSKQQSYGNDDEVRSKNAELFVAICKGKLHKVKTLLGSGVKTDIIDKNNKDNTPLHYAVEKGKTEIVAELLDPKWKTSLSLTNNEGRTPLDIAVQKNYEEIIELLQNHQIDVIVESKNVETAFVKLVQEKPEPANQKNNFSLNFQKTSGAAGIEGQLCEINLSIWLLLKGKVDAHLTEFYLASNFEKADKFDDIVFKYINQAGTSKTIFLQSKHKTGDQEKKNQRIQLTSILSDSESGDFSLNKYFISYRKIKRHFLRNENTDDPIFSGDFDNCEFLIYTNAPFDQEHKNCIREIAMDDNDLFKIKDSRGKCYQLVYDSDEKQKIFDTLKNSSDCRRLAKALAAAFYSKAGLDIQKDIFQSYHKALREKVIQQTKGLYGRLSEDFFSSASEHQFGTVFFEEAAKVFNKSVDNTKLQLETMVLKLSNKFWDENANGISDLPQDDPIEEHEVESFLSKFKLYVEQPNEKTLERAVKKIATTFYKVKQQDIHAVFSDVATKVKNWWQVENNFLVKDNTFFEDALRVSIEFDVIEPVVSFTGRAEILGDLHKMLQEGGAGCISQIATITGLGGIGKSETARKYLSAYKEHYDNNIIWINAATRLTITQSFQKLAKDKLGINTTDEKNKEIDIKLLTEEVYNFFDRMHRKSLFVFDNAEKQGPGDKYVDELLPSGLNKPYVIITTRDQDWDGIEKLPLGFFTQEEAEAFVRNALKGIINIEDNELRKLTKELDCLPLALKQAVAYISVENKSSKTWSNKQFTISYYLDQFQKNSNPLLSSGTMKNHTQAIMKTWKTSIKKIKHGCKRALKILQVLAYLAPDQIPVDEIFVRKKRKLKKIRRAIEVLAQYSIISIEGGNVKIHRLVQNVIRTELEEKGQNEQTLASAFALLEACYKRDKMDAYFMKRRILPHLEAFSSHIEMLIKTKKPEGQGEIFADYLSYLLNWITEGYENNPRRRKELQERALTIFEGHYGLDHFHVATTLYHLGSAYGDLGDTHKQKELLERALTINESYYGPDHFQVGRSLNNLGNCYGALGDAQKKKELLERALAINEGVYGPAHFNVAITLTNLGEAYGALGDARKKKELLERALTINEGFHGPDHFNVAITLTNLGDTYGALGDASKKKELLERALTINEDYYAPDHFQVAITLSNLGNAYGAFGDAQKKKELLERALTINEAYYAPDHFNVAITLTDLGDAYGALGDARKQKELLERALTIKEGYFGPDHFQVAVTLKNLGDAYGALGDARKQKELLERALKINEGYYGLDHFQVAITLEKLGEAYGCSGDAQEKKELLERALTIKEGYYGPDHFQVAITLENLGEAYGALGNAQKKKELLERTLPIYEGYYGRDHFQVAITLENLGEAYGRLGDAQEKKELLERALTIKEGYYGPDHFQVAVTLENLGEAYGALGNAQKKKELLERTLPIYEGYYGRDHFQVAITLENLGEAYGRSGDAQEKKKLLERALTINEGYYGSDHIRVAITLRNLGHVYGALGDAHKEKELLERALTMFEGYYGSEHFQVSFTHSYLGSAYRCLGDAEKQKMLVERALPILEYYYEPDRCQVARTIINLGSAYGCLGDAQKQKELMERVLTIYENFYRPNDGFVATALSNLGNAYGDLGDALKNKELQERALAIIEKNHAPDHCEVAITLTSLGDAYCAVGDAHKSKQLLERALPIKQNYYGSDHYQVAFTLDILGNAYGDLGDAHKQKELQERALQIKENYYGPDNIEVAFTLRFLGNAFRALGDAQKQKELLERSLKIKEKHYGPDHPQVARARALLLEENGTLGYPDEIKSRIYLY